MVHGCIYSVEYEIYLNKPLDLFDQVLPLCTKVRKMIEYTEKNGTYKLVILNYNDLIERFEANPLTMQYKEEIYKADYNDLYYSEVLTYSRFVKNELIIPMTDEEFNQLVTNIKELDETGQWTTEYYKLYRLKHIQEIVRNESFESIVQMEKELTKIELTQDELNIINTIKNDKLIAPIIKSASINLCCIHY
jgi:hypothetical protein